MHKFEDFIMRILRLSLLFVIFLLYSSNSFACDECQYYDPPPATSYQNYINIASTTTATVGGDALEDGDEIGVFVERDGEYILIGALDYKENDRTYIPVNKETENPDLTITPGARDGEEMLIRVWDASANDGAGKEATFSYVTLGDCLQQIPVSLCKNDNMEFETQAIFYVYPIDEIEALFIPPTPVPVFPENNQAGVALNPTISWSEHIDAQYWDVIVSLSEDFSDTVTEAFETEDNQITTDIDNFNTDFWWQVRAGNDAGWSAWGTYHARTLLPGATLTSPADESISLPVDVSFSWEEVDGAEQYRVQVSTDENDFSAPIFEADVEETSHDFTGFDNYSTYYWRVIPLDEMDGEYYEGQVSDVWQLRTIVGPPNLTNPADDDVAIGLTPTFEWDAADGATYYELEYTTDPLFVDNVVNVNNITETSYENPGLDYFTEYHWRVRSHNDIPETSEWTYASFTTVVGPPTLVSPVDGDGGQELTVTLDWDAPANGGATMYDLWYSTDPTFATYTEITDIEDTEQQITGLDYYTVYYWKVKAYNEDGGTWTDYYFEFRTKVDAPELVSPVDGAADQNAPDLMFDWNTVTGATEYQIQIATDNGFTDIVDDAVINPADEYTSYDVLFDTEQYWRVRAADEFGYGEWSEIWDFETEGLPTPVLVFPANNATEVKLNTRFDWEDLLYATYFHIQVSESQGFETLVYENDEISPDESEFYIPGGNLEPLTEYYWRISAIYGTQETPWSEVRKFQTQDIPVPVLSAPTNGSDDHPLEVTLEWVPIDNADHYNVQVSTDEDFQQASIIVDEEVSDTELFIDDEVITYMTTYYWRVSLTLDGQTGRWSEAWSFETQDYPPLEVDLADEIVTCYGDTDVELGNWIEEEGEEGYYTVTGGSGNYRIMWVPNSYMDDRWTANPSLRRVPNFSRYYTIRVLDLVTREVGIDRVYLRVNRGPTIGGIPRAYYIEEGEDVDLGEGLIVQGDDPFTYYWEDRDEEWSSTEENPNVAPTVTTDYYLTVTDDNGCESTKLVSVVVRDPKQGEYGAVAGVYIHLSPNPTEGMVELSADFGREVDVEMNVINMLGMSVINKQFNGVNGIEDGIDLSMLPSGAYMIRFSFDGEIVYRKVIKQ